MFLDLDTKNLVDPEQWSAESAPRKHAWVPWHGGLALHTGWDTLGNFPEEQ